MSTAALSTIEAADLSAPCYRTARRLLDRAGSNGVLWLDLASALQVAATDSANTLRRHLSDLAASGIVDYQIDGRAGVWVRFVAFGVITQCASVITQCATPITQCATPAAANGNGAAPVITQRADTITQRADNPPLIPPIGLVGWLDPERPDPTNQPGRNGHGGGDSEGQPAIGTAEHARSYALLIDPEVGVAPRKAMQLAGRVAFVDLLRYVGAWSADYAAGRVRSSGALVARVEQELGAGPVSAAFRESALYARHVDVAAELRAMYGLPDLPADVDGLGGLDDAPEGPDDDALPMTNLDELPPESGDQALSAIWGQALMELAQSLPAGVYDTWLRDTRLVSSDGGVAVVHVPNRHALDWLRERLTRRLQRTLGSLTGQRLTVDFVVGQ